MDGSTGKTRNGCSCLHRESKNSAANCCDYIDDGLASSIACSVAHICAGIDVDRSPHHTLQYGALSYRSSKGIMCQRALTHLKALLSQAGLTDAVIEAALLAYQAPHRFYHTLQHLEDMYLLLASHQTLSTSTSSASNNDLIIAYALAIVFHDVCYDPESPHNEQDSVFWYLLSLGPHATPNSRVMAMILSSTAPPLTAASAPSFPDWLNQFTYWDYALFYKNSHEYQVVKQQLLRWESGIFKEYLPLCVKQAATQNQLITQVYQKARLDFINRLLMTSNRAEIPRVVHQVLMELCNALTALGMGARTDDPQPYFLIVPGTFNPMHQGHQRMIQQAEQAFFSQTQDGQTLAWQSCWQGVVLSVGTPEDKSTLSASERAQSLRQVTHYAVSVHGDHIKNTFKLCGLKQGARICLVRGIRSKKDETHELKQRQFVEAYLSSVSLAPESVAFYYYQAGPDEQESSTLIRAARTQVNNKSVNKAVNEAVNWSLPHRAPHRHPRLLAMLTEIQQRSGGVYGIIGPIASGKSTVSQWYSVHKGWHIINLDQLWAEELKKSAVCEQIDLIIPGARNAQGELDRDRLRSAIFSDGTTEKIFLEGFAQPIILLKLLKYLVHLPEAETVLIEISAPKSAFSYFLIELIQRWYWIERAEKDCIQALAKRLNLPYSAAETYWQSSRRQSEAFRSQLQQCEVVSLV